MLCRLPSLEVSTSGHMTIEQTYDLEVVVLSVLFALAAVYAAIHVTGPGSRTGMWRRIVWLAAPVAILGGGLWTAHDFGLRVFGFQILYHYSTVLVVTLAAVVSSTVAIRTVRRGNAARANAARFETLAEGYPSDYLDRRFIRPYHLHKPALVSDDRHV
jgi:NO-binding membrane sensor protein with MHYT domain